MAEQTDSPELCSRCEKSPLDAEGFPKWCRECRRIYAKENRALKLQLTESRGFAAGVAAMRAHIAAHWGQWPSAVFSGAEVSMKTRQLPGPNESQL